VTWFGYIAVGLACLWLALIAVFWGSFGGFFAAIFALAFEHLRKPGPPGSAAK
jgi:hypothetical protein